jgi:hypothetical protein
MFGGYLCGPGRLGVSRGMKTGGTIVDDNEMDFTASHFDSVEAIELRDEGVRIGFHVLYCQLLIFSRHYLIILT